MLENASRSFVTKLYGQRFFANKINQLRFAEHQSQSGFSFAVSRTNQAASLLGRGGIAVSVLSADLGSRYLTSSNVKSSACLAPRAKFSTDSSTVFWITSSSVLVFASKTSRSRGTPNNCSSGSIASVTPSLKSTSVSPGCNFKHAAVYTASGTKPTG